MLQMQSGFVIPDPGGSETKTCWISTKQAEPRDWAGGAGGGTIGFALTEGNLVLLDLDSLLAQVEGGTAPKKSTKKGARPHSKETIWNYLEVGGVVWPKNSGYESIFFYDEEGLIWISSAKPGEAVRNKLKAAGMRWYPPKRLWWLPGTFNAPLSELSSAKIAAFKRALGFTPAYVQGQSED